MTSILPPNATDAERAVEAAAAARLDALSFSIANLWSVEACPEAYLPWLAWALSVDVWKPHWPVSVKRQVIASSFEVHVMKGTRAGVELAVGALGVETRITEWFEPGGSGEPYTYKLRALASRALDPASPAVVDEGFAALVTEILDAVAPLRSRVSLETGAAAPLTLGVFTRSHGVSLERSAAEVEQRAVRPPAGLALGTRSCGVSAARVACELTGLAA